jgi:hypothetical protein
MLGRHLMLTRCLPLWLVVLATIIGAACAPSADVTNFAVERCQELAEKNAIDADCAIQSAKKAIEKKQGKMVYSKFDAHFDSTSSMWSVMAKYEPEVHGGHLFVSVRQNGEVTEIYPGM